MRTFRAAALAAVAMALLSAGCGAGGGHSGGPKPSAALPGRGRPPVRLATKNFPEQFVLGQLYAQALEAKGFTVVLKQNVGSSEIVDRALAEGQIDMYPEYIGVIAGELARSRTRPRSEEETYRRAQAYEQRRGFTLLARTPGYDADANAVKPALARRFRLRSTADLKRLGRFRYGGPAENQTRFQGAVGMRQVYGLDRLVYVPVQIAARYAALDSGRIDVAAAFTTDPELTMKRRYVVLSDPKGIFGFQNIAPVVSAKLLRAEGPAFARTIDAVSAKLTNDALRRMNAAVVLSGERPADVARRFLSAHGLV